MQIFLPNDLQRPFHRVVIAGKIGTLYMASKLLQFVELHLFHSFRDKNSTGNTRFFGCSGKGKAMVACGTGRNAPLFLHRPNRRAHKALLEI